MGNENKQYPCCCGDMGCLVVSRGVAAAMAVYGTAGQLGHGVWWMSYVLEMVHWNAGHCLMVVFFCFSWEKVVEETQSSWGLHESQPGRVAVAVALRRGDTGTGLNSLLTHSSSFHGEELEKPLPICDPKRLVVRLTQDTIPRNSLGEGKGIETSFASSHEAITPQRSMLAHVPHSRCEAVVGSYRMEELQRAGWRALSPRTAPALWQGCGFWFPQAQKGVNPSFPTSRVEALTTELLNEAEESSNSCCCASQSTSALCFGNVHWLYPLGEMGAGAGKLSSLDLTVPECELTGCHDMRGISGHAHSRISGVWRILMWKAGASGV